MIVCRKRGASEQEKIQYIKYLPRKVCVKYATIMRPSSDVRNRIPALVPKNVAHNLRQNCTTTPSRTPHRHECSNMHACTLHQGYHEQRKVVFLHILFSFFLFLSERRKGVILIRGWIQIFRLVSGPKKQPKHRVFGRDIPGTSGTQTSGYPGQNLYATRLFLLF